MFGSFLHLLLGHYSVRIGNPNTIIIRARSLLKSNV